MFFRRRPPIDINVNVELDAEEIKTTLEKLIMSNQELFDSYAAKIADQNSQIKAAVAVILSEVAKLQKAAEAPLDTTKMDAALSQLTAAVDEVEAIPTPVAEEPPAPVEPVEIDPQDLADEESDEQLPDEE